MAPTNVSDAHDAGFAARYAAVQARIAAACARVGRAPEAVTCIAVSKTQPAKSVAAAVAAGVRDLGENYVQEWQGKQAELAAGAAAAAGVRWHFIGHLQRNKAKFVAGEAHLVHAVDSLELAQELGKRAQAKGRRQAVLVAVNLGGEASKSGVAPDAVAALVGSMVGIEGIEVQGLMTVPPPASESGDGNRAYFAQLRQLRDAVATKEHPLPHLSMGMSDDFEIAIEEGATLVRLGTVLFGARPPAPVRAVG